MWMAYIEQVSEEDADGLVAGIYGAARQRAGYVANIMKVMSRDGRSLQGSMQFYVALMKSPNALSPARREMLATVVSNANDCYY
jgi:alkylhydroperoxidase family enzyme